MPLTATGKVRRRNQAKLPLLLILFCFALAAGCTSYLAIQQDQTVHRLARYDDAFDAGQGAVELLRFQDAVSAFALGLPDSSEDIVNLRLEIFENRFEILSRESFKSFIAGHSEIDGVLDELSVALKDIKVLMPRLSEKGVAAQIIAELTPLDPDMTRLSSITSTLVGTQIEIDQAHLKNLHLISSGVIFALIVVGVLLIIMLLRDNRLMLEANRHLSLLTEDLQVAGAALTSAHSAVAKANEDLAAQNAALRNRDEALRIQNTRFDAALNNMSHGLLMADRNDRLIVSNTRFLEMFGLRPAEAEAGAPLEDLFRIMGQRQSQPRAVIERIREQTQAFVAQKERGSFYAESDGRSIQVGHMPMAEGGWVATYEDITERRKVEANTDYIAHHDALTDLPNRLMFTLRMAEALRDRAADRFFALLLLDVDHFKDVNDTLGHLAGDALLVMIARRLRGCVRDEDVVARLGGDEFAILQMQPRSRDETVTLAHRLVEAVGQPYSIDGRRVVAGVSVGIAICNDETNDAEQLLRSADMALYRSKAEGRNTSRFFEAEMETAVQVRSTIAADIRDALEQDRFEVLYQPVFEVATGHLAQFEGLLRWNHPTLGTILPSRFIPVAEDSRLIIPIGESVIRRACMDAADWPANIRVAVNLSPTQFEDRGLTKVVESALRNAGLQPSRLELEITEGALLRDGDEVRSMLLELRALGVTIALDDFGTGYASLSYLRHFPFDKIKIDRSFIGDLGSRSDSIAIVESVIKLATKLGMATTAEGIETAEQWNFLSAVGCTYVQGYYFDRPRSLATVQRKMESGEYALPLGLEPGWAPRPAPTPTAA
jgi:diguanylate cyclase (GGDEF)-like protein/PAS domain S-box-containing protein